MVPMVILVSGLCLFFSQLVKSTVTIHHMITCVLGSMACSDRCFKIVWNEFKPNLITMNWKIVLTIMVLILFGMNLFKLFVSMN